MARSNVQWSLAYLKVLAWSNAGRKIPPVAARIWSTISEKLADVGDGLEMGSLLALHFDGNHSSG
jgi:hypothetical protein